MEYEVSADIPDWSREIPVKFWDPGRRLLRTIRKYQALSVKSNNFVYRIIKKYWVIEYIFWSVITGAEIDLSCQIGGGLLIPHPNGIVIHPNAIIGPNCLIFQQVTIGTIGREGATPKIGGHVDIGAGAKILGPIFIANHSRVGANAVVTKNVSARQTVAGIPAQPV